MTSDWLTVQRDIPLFSSQGQLPFQKYYNLKPGISNKTPAKACQVTLMSEAGLLRTVVKLKERLLEWGLSLHVCSRLFPNRHYSPVLLKTYFYKRSLKCGFLWIPPMFKFCPWIQTLHRSSITCQGQKWSKARKFITSALNGREYAAITITHTLLFPSSRNWRTHTPLMHLQPLPFFMLFHLLWVTMLPTPPWGLTHFGWPLLNVTPSAKLSKPLLSYQTIFLLPPLENESIFSLRC